MSTVSRSESTDYEPAQLIADHQAGVWRYLRALGCDPALADDLTQDTFVAVLEKPIQHYAATTTAAYLRKVAYHRFVSHQRRLGRVTCRSELETIDAEWNRWAAHDDGETLIETLRDCLHDLTNRARSALELQFCNRRTREEIAAALNVGPHGAKNILQRAKQQLRKCIERKLQ